MKLFLAAVTLLAVSACGQPISEKASTAKVIVVEGQGATEALRANAEPIRAMVRKGITVFTGKRESSEGWRSLVTTEDVVGIKVFAKPGRTSGTRPEVVEAVVEGLIESGVQATNIIIWDKQPSDLRLSGFYRIADRHGVRVEASAQAGYDPDHFYDSAIIGNLVYGDLEFGKEGPKVGRRSFVSKLVTQQITKIICISPLLNHTRAGLSGSLYSLASGSVDNFFRFETDRERLATAVPEIYGLPELYDKVVLNIMDALLSQYEGNERGLLHYSEVLNQVWFSKDAVALDVMGIEELERQRKAAGTSAMKPNREIYSNASLLELGMSDLKRIEVVRVNSNPDQAGNR